jgi:uncharacterized membrane protein
LDVRPRAGSTSQTRLRSIDAARGATMLFVLVSHFGRSYFDGGDVRGAVLQTITMIGSPTFMVISGMVVGFLHCTRPNHFNRLRITLAYRGLFLLTIGHAVILAGSWPLIRTARYLLITDAIGVSMLVGPAMVSRVSSAGRLIIAASLFALSWVAIGFWHPTSFAGRLALETLFGSLHPSIYRYTLPLVPWCCLDLVASAVGERLGTLFVAGDVDGMRRLVARVGAVSVALALSAKLGYVIVKDLSAGVALHNPWLSAAGIFTSPGMRFPPSAGYLVFYSGLGWCWIYLWLSIERSDWAPRLINNFAALGQVSLFMFVAQYYVYFTVIYLVRPHLPFAWAWPVYLVISMLAVILPALEWHRRGYRRFMRVGFKHWYNRRLVHHVERAASTAPRSAVALE